MRGKLIRCHAEGGPQVRSRLAISRKRLIPLGMKDLGDPYGPVRKAPVKVQRWPTSHRPTARADQESCRYLPLSGRFKWTKRRCIKGPFGNATPKGQGRNYESSSALLLCASRFRSDSARPVRSQERSPVAAQLAVDTQVGSNPEKDANIEPSSMRKIAAASHAR
jgi:hypothetical protein